MMSDSPATEPTKTALENSVSYFLGDMLHDPAITIATKKYLTGKNELVYITRCNVEESAVPRVKVQLFVRVARGVHETGYNLFSDHRFVKYKNEMIFGNRPGTANGTQTSNVTEVEAAQVLQLVNGLANARQTL
jgi:hypothetical protein